MSTTRKRRVEVTIPTAEILEEIKISAKAEARSVSSFMVDCAITQMRGGNPNSVSVQSHEGTIEQLRLQLKENELSIERKEKVVKSYRDEVEDLRMRMLEEHDPLARPTLLERRAVLIMREAIEIETSTLTEKLGLEFGMQDDLRRLQWQREYLVSRGIIELNQNGVITWVL